MGMYIPVFVWRWCSYLEVMVFKMGLATIYNVYNVNESAISILSSSEHHIFPLITIIITR